MGIYMNVCIFIFTGTAGSLGVIEVPRGAEVHKRLLQVDVVHPVPRIYARALKIIQKRIVGERAGWSCPPRTQKLHTKNGVFTRG
jgi:hypothetical protein